MDSLVTIILFSLLLITAFAVASIRNLFAVVMLTGVFSLLSASLFVVMDAVDVAFTEAAVGAGIATVLMLSTLAVTSSEEKPAVHSRLLPLLVTCAAGGALIYGTLDMPAFGALDAPVHQHINPEYIDSTPKQTGIPNVVTAILASYRGFDTLGEVVVIFAAGIAVLLLLHRSTRPGKHRAKAGGR